ncbi:hypothetical protein [Klebsiella oxytoca]|uniref:hypothetical protein n=1 Tax=Klebsiella oxytoca TaxID=571 RepID=UPI003D80204F
MNQLRLPISPLRHGKDTENVLDYTCHWLLRKRQNAIAALSVEKNSASRISVNIQYVPQVNLSFSPFPLAVSSFSESARKILQTPQFGLHFGNLLSDPVISTRNNACTFPKQDFRNALLSDRTDAGELLARHYSFWQKRRLL